MKGYDRPLWVLFLVALVVSQAANIHSFQHSGEDEDSNHCELCLLIAFEDQFDTLPVSICAEQERVLFVAIAYRQIDGREQLYFDNHRLEIPFTRPPPSI